MIIERHIGASIELDNLKSQPTSSQLTLQHFEFYYLLKAI